MSRVLVQRTQVVVALSRGATLIAREAYLLPAQAEALASLLGWLVHLGHVASFCIQPASCAEGRQGMEGALRAKLGALVVDACEAAGSPPPAPAPAFIVPVWAFDHQVDGRPAATGNFLGLDLEVLATPSPDEEVGIHLPDRPGLWLVHARPLGLADFAHESPTTSQ